MISAWLQEVQNDDKQNRIGLNKRHGYLIILSK